jgi:hypothetical protein
MQRISSLRADYADEKSIEAALLVTEAGLADEAGVAPRYKAKWNEVGIISMKSNRRSRRKKGKPSSRHADVDEAAILMPDGVDPSTESRGG